MLRPVVGRPQMIPKPKCDNRVSSPPADEIPVGPHSNGRGADRDRLVPPLSPVLLLGMALRHVPLPVFQLPLALAMRAMRRRHGGIFERLGDIDEPVFVIDPVDLPFRFLLRASATQPSLRAIPKDGYVDAKASVLGPFMAVRNWGPEGTQLPLEALRVSATPIFGELPVVLGIEPFYAFPSAVLLFAFLSFFIGTFLQLLWEDLPFTEPM